MNIREKCINYKQKFVTPPIDLKIIVAVACEGTLILSKQKNYGFKVRYGLQERDFNNIQDAMAEFTNCIIHDESN